MGTCTGAVCIMSDGTYILEVHLEFSEQEMKEMKTKVEGMTSRVTELEVTNSALQRRIGELLAQIDEMGRMQRSVP